MSFVERNPIRKVHITRILGTNKAGDVLPEIWADVERFEVFSRDTQITDVIKGTTGQYQKIDTKFRWHDDPDVPDEYRPEDDKGTARNTEVLKVCSPDEDDLDDPEEWIPIRVIKEVYLHEAYAGVTQKRLTTVKLQKDRHVEYRRIYHYDTNIDDEAEAAFDADPERKAYVVKGYIYQKDDETKDDSQYIEAELVKAILKYDSDHEFSTGASQQTYLKLKNQYLLDETEEAKLEELGTDDKNPPYRLDPFQNIVNVQFASLLKVVAGLFRINHSDEYTLISKDGDEWTDGYGAGTASVASGFGYTVLGRADRLLAFGTPRDGASCFIAAGQDGKIERGILNDSGELQWTTVGTLPGGARAASCCLAGDAFFISYGSAFEDVSLLAVSFDGEDFTYDIDPFPGVGGVSNPDGFLESPDPGPFGGNVAYNKKTGRYVTTGGFQLTHDAIVHDEDGTTNPGFVDENLMTSVSDDGLSWSPYFDLSQGGDSNTWNPTTGIGMRASGPSTVCFGKGVFVCAASYKNLFVQDRVSGDDWNMVGQVCGIATSANGTGWSCQRLPNTLSSDANNDLIDGGDTRAVIFIKTKGTTVDGYPDGFFVALGTEFTNLYPAFGYSRKAKIWTSDDGYDWRLVHTESDDAQGWILSAVNKRDGKLVDK